MRRLFGPVLVGALAIVALAVPSTITGRADATRVIGSYAFFEAIHDPSPPGTGQEAASVGTLTFDGTGNFTGVYSQNTRGCIVPCGDLEVTRVSVTGTDTVFLDGSATLDLCLRIGTGNLPVGQGVPQNVEVIAEGSFSLDFTHFRFTETEIRSGPPASTGLCVPAGTPFSQLSTVVTGTAEKV